jgi:hypothetical protein
MKSFPNRPVEQTRSAEKQTYSAPNEMHCKPFGEAHLFGPERSAVNTFATLSNVKKGKMHEFACLPHELHEADISKQLYRM